MTKAAIFEFSDINARMRMIRNEIEHEVHTRLNPVEVRMPQEDDFPVGAVIYGFREIAAVLEEFEDLSEDALEQIEIDFPTPAAGHQPAVFAYAEIRDRMAVMQGKKPTNTLYHHPMLSDSDGQKALYRHWAEDVGVGGFTMEGYVARQGHEYDIMWDGCKRCLREWSDIMELDLRICPGPNSGEACIQCGEKAYVSLSHTKWGVSEGGSRNHFGRCLSCGWRTATDLDDPRKGHRFLPPRKPVDMSNAHAVAAAGYARAEAEQRKRDGVALNAATHPTDERKLAPRLTFAERAEREAIMDQERVRLQKIAAAALAATLAVEEPLRQTMAAWVQYTPSHALKDDTAAALRILADARLMASRSGDMAKTLARESMAMRAIVGPLRS